jgi:hypothetical protein
LRDGSTMSARWIVPHNNHHAHPRSPIDPSWPVVRALATVGLVATTGTPVADDRLHTSAPPEPAVDPVKGRRKGVDR